MKKLSILAAIVLGFFLIGCKTYSNIRRMPQTEFSDKTAGGYKLDVVTNYVLFAIPAGNLYCVSDANGDLDCQ